MTSMSDSRPSKKNFKIVLLGDSGVGKTALIQRFTHNKFQGKQNPTIGIDFVGKNVNLHGQTYRLQLWDTAGQQRYRSLIPSYLKDAISAVFVFDITNNQSLRNLQLWIQLFKENKIDKSILVICANKIDLKQKQSYSEQILQEIKKKHKIKDYFTSASSGEGVNEMFHSIIENVHSRQQKKKKKIDQTIEYTGAISSTNLHSQEMRSNRSNTSNMDGDQERVQQTKTGVKISKSDPNKKINSKQTIGQQQKSLKAQGNRRCC